MTGTVNKEHINATESINSRYYIKHNIESKSQLIHTLLLLREVHPSLKIEKSETS